jgi:hypothetical protein
VEIEKRILGPFGDIDVKFAEIWECENREKRKTGVGGDGSEGKLPQMRKGAWWKILGIE